MKKVLFLGLCLTVLTLFAGQKNPDTEWMARGKVGVFMHYLVGEGNFAFIDSFDVEGLANQLAEVQAAWFCLTLGQNSGWYLAPNDRYERIAGYPKNERCAARDLPLELGKALARRGIRFMLYLPCQTPNRDLQAVKAFGLPEKPVNGDRKLTRPFVDEWARVIETWSVRYGDSVSGWWFDGGYRWVGFTDEDAAVYAAAVRKGNPKAIVAMNRGVSMGRGTAVDDYTAGEQNEPFDKKCAGRWSDGAQWHVLTYLGKTWGEPSVRASNETWYTWLRDVTDKGGAVTIDVSPRSKEGGLNPRGLIHPDHFRQLKAVFPRIRAQ